MYKHNMYQYTHTHTHAPSARCEAECKNTPEHNVAVGSNVLSTILYANGIGLRGHSELLLTGFSESFQVPLHTFEMGVEIGQVGKN